LELDMRYHVLKKGHFVALVGAKEGLSDRAFADGYRIAHPYLTMAEVQELGYDWDDLVSVKTEQHSGFAKVDPPGQKESAYNDGPVMDRKPRGFRPVY
jgi:hypothetical protein